VAAITVEGDYFGSACRNFAGKQFWIVGFAKFTFEEENWNGIINRHTLYCNVCACVSERGKECEKPKNDTAQKHDYKSPTTAKHMLAHQLLRAILKAAVGSSNGECV